MNELSYTKPRIQDNPFFDENSSIFDANILVVDDAALIRELIGAYLQSAGYNNISYAFNGKNALDLIDENIPDLVILDLEMPVMDGFEVCKKLRSRPETKNLPILIQSGRDTATDLTKAFSYGASDMVLKPVKKYEILARIKVHLENQIFVRKLTAYHDRVASELEQARRLQVDICPTKQDLKEYLQNYNVDIGWYYEPSSEIGGDIGGIFPIDKNRIAFYIADFSGHGVAAALNTFRLQSWLASASKLYTHPEKLLSELNNFLHSNLASGSYATMLFFCLDIKKRELTYSAAGSQQPLVQYPNLEEEFQLLSSKGMPLGLRKDWTYNSTTIPFDQNTRLMIYSDALVEVKMPDGDFLGDEGLRKEVSQLWTEDLSHEKLLPIFVENFHQRIGECEPDDLTIICLENLNEYRN
ncbi:MAG: SpoIIE family protein phosphatase [Sneathiella sp.]|nr:SpoIIE family protein phosphatase [Sneathiella sp.]